jgi:hypothetical protein
VHKITNAIVDISSIENSKRNQVVDIIKGCIDQYLMVLVKTHKDFCDYTLTTSVISMNDDNKMIGVLGIQVTTTMDFSDILRALWNIPTYGFTPLTGMSQDDIELMANTIILGIKQHPELINVEPFLFFVELDILQTKDKP